MVPIYLILDLDETLISAISLDKSLARPGLNDFLDFCFANFQSVSIWTASSKDWWLLNYSQHFSKYTFDMVLTGERCSHKWNYLTNGHENPTYDPYKPLRKLWRRNFGMTCHNTLIVDDEPFNSWKNYGNALNIHPFNGDKNDQELKRIQTALEQIIIQFQQTKSIRKINLREI